MSAYVFRQDLAPILERLAGITDRTAFWIGNHASHLTAQQEIDLAVNRMKWRWLRRLVKEVV